MLLQEVIQEESNELKVQLEQKGNEYFQRRYNIATWFWELSSFPDEWVSRFSDYQEIIVRVISL